MAKIQKSVLSLAKGERVIVTFAKSIGTREAMETLVNADGAAAPRRFKIRRHLKASRALVVELPSDAQAAIQRIKNLPGVLFVDEDDEGLRVPLADDPACDQGGTGGSHSGGGGGSTFSVIGSLPANNALDAIPGQRIKFAFSQDVKKSTVVINSTFVVKEGATPVTGGSFTWADNRNLYYNPPSGHWHNAATYSVKLTKGIKNTSSKALVAEYQILFTGVLATPGTLVAQALIQIDGPNPGLNGAGVHVAILDSGADTDHPDRPVNLLPGTSTVDGVPTAEDDAGHGTGTSGLVAGNTNGGRYSAAPAATITPVKVLNASNIGTTSDLVEGLNWCVQWNQQNPGNPIHIISMSLVNYPSSNSALNQALSGAHAAGMLLVASAGNGFHGAVTWPAGHANVLAVSAIDNNNALTYFSSIGADVELCAPGNFVYTTKRNGGYVNFSGTSASAPLVAGAAALHKQADPSLTNVALANRIKQVADNIGLPATEQGSGRVDCTEP